MSSNSLTKNVRILLKGLSTKTSTSGYCQISVRNFLLDFRPENVSSKQNKTNKQKKKKKQKNEMNSKNFHWYCFYYL